MLRRSARSAGIAPRNEDADHEAEPETEVEARGHVGRRDVEGAGAEEGTAGEGERKEPSNWDENEGPGDSGAAAGVGEGYGTEYVGTGGGALAEDGFGCDDCAIKDSTMLGIRSRLREVRQALVQTRQELVKLRSKPSSGGKAEVTRAVNQVATLQKELANSNAALSRAERAVEKLTLLARRENLAKQQAEYKAGLAAVERDEAFARASVVERALARAEGATAPQQLRRSLLAAVPLEADLCAIFAAPGVSEVPGAAAGPPAGPGGSPTGPVVTDPSVATATMQQPVGDNLGATMTAGAREVRLFTSTAAGLTGAVEEAEAGAASPEELAFGARALAHDAAALAHLWADVELHGQSEHRAPAPLPASTVPAAAAPPLVAARVGEPKAPAQRPVRASEPVSSSPGRRSVPSNRGARAAAVRIGVRLLEKLQIEPVAWDLKTAKRKAAAARLGAVSGKTDAYGPDCDALGDRWRGSGAAKRPREPGGAQGLPAAVAVAYGVVDMAVMGAVPGS